MNEPELGKYLRRKISGKQKTLFALSLPCLSLASALIFGGDFGATAEHPGGVFFETSFWMTSVGTAFLSFIMMDVLFRSDAARLLASWPVRPEKLFVYQMRRVFAGIGLSLIPFAAFWLPHVMKAPIVVLLSILMWPAGLAVCAAVSAAVILYTGNAGTGQKKNRTSFGAISFSMAPAVSLAVSLMISLLLKLLAEALLKPGFVDAALTAVSISFCVFAVSLIYAYCLYKKRYYAILASFMDTDMVQLNASYEFIGGKKAESFRKAENTTKLVSDAYQLMYSRRHPVAVMLVVTYAVISSLVLLNMPDYMDSPFIPLIAVVPWVIFSKPWAAFVSADFSTELLDALPIEHGKVFRARMMAVFSIMCRHCGILAVAIAVPYYYHGGLIGAFFHALAAFALCAAVTAGFSSFTLKRN